MSKLILLIVPLLLLLPGPAFGAAIDQIGWTAPTQNEDGSVLIDLAGYNVYIGTASGVYTTTVPIADPTVTQALNLPFSLAGVQDGDQVFVAMKSLDTTGNESTNFSNEVLTTVSVVDNIAPNAPAIITITISVGVDCPAGFTCTAN